MTTHELHPAAGDPEAAVSAPVVAGIGTVGERYATGSLVQETALYRVYAAHDLHLERPVHLLVLRPERGERSASVGLFAATVASTADVAHPILAGVFDAGIDERPSDIIRWAAREPVLDPPLLDLEAPDDLDVGEWGRWALHVAITLANGMQEVHAHGLVHGDLGPRTVHVSPPGTEPVRVKIDGFGPQPADLTDLSDPERTRAMWAEFTAGLGNPAPEQLAGRAPSRRTDVFGYGLVVNALLLEAEAHVALSGEHTLAVGATDPVLRGLQALAAAATSEAAAGRPYSFAVVQQELRRLAPGETGEGLASGVKAGGRSGHPIVEQAPTAVLPPIGATAPSRATDAPGTDTVRNALLRPVAKRSSGARPAVAVAVVIAVLAAVAALVWFTISQGDAASVGDITIPTVAGLTVDEASGVLRDVGLSPSGTREQPDPSVPAGAIVGTEPAVGERAHQGAPITLLVSTGADLVSVPQLEGLSTTAAQEALAAAGLSAGEISRRDGTLTEGTVLDSDPAFGVRTPRGSAVGLVVATGRIGVPSSIVGQTSQAAIAQLQALGLQVQTRSEVTDSVDAGLVASSDPRPGASVQLGGIVTLVIAEAPAVVVPAPVPSATPTEPPTSRPTPRPSQPSSTPTNTPVADPDEGGDDVP